MAVFPTLQGGGREVGPPLVGMLGKQYNLNRIKQQPPSSVKVATITGQRSALAGRRVKSSPNINNIKAGD